MHSNKEKLVGYDFQGWPIFKMTLKEILLGLGGKEEDNKIIEIQNKTNMTDESEYIKREFIDIKKKIGNIEKMILNVNNIIEKEQNLRANRPKGKGKITDNKNKITIEIDISPFNIIMGLIVVSIIISVVVTGKKLFYNLKGNAIAQGGVHIKE